MLTHLKGDTGHIKIEKHTRKKGRKNSQAWNEQGRLMWRRLEWNRDSEWKKERKRRKRKERLHTGRLTGQDRTWSPLDNSEQNRKNSEQDMKVHGMTQKKSLPGCDSTGKAHTWKKAAAYSPALHCSTIGDGGLNFSVRNGKRWDTAAIATWLYPHAQYKRAVCRTTQAIDRRNRCNTAEGCTHSEDSGN